MYVSFIHKQQYINHTKKMDSLIHKQKRINFTPEYKSLFHSESFPLFSMSQEVNHTILAGLHTLKIFQNLSGHVNTM